MRKDSFFFFAASPRVPPQPTPQRTRGGRPPPGHHLPPHASPHVPDAAPGRGGIAAAASDDSLITLAALSRVSASLRRRDDGSFAVGGRGAGVSRRRGRIWRAALAAEVAGAVGARSCEGESRHRGVHAQELGERL